MKNYPIYFPYHIIEQHNMTIVSFSIVVYFPLMVYRLLKVYISIEYEFQKQNKQQPTTSILKYYKPTQITP